MAAIAAACRCIGQLRGHSMTSKAPSSVTFLRRYFELVKSERKRVPLIDTLALVERLESQGVPSMQAKAIVTAITDVSSYTVENASYSFVSKEDIKRYELTQEAQLSKFKSEVQDSQKTLFSRMKIGPDNLEDIRSKSRIIKDELTHQREEISELAQKLDRKTLFSRIKIDRDISEDIHIQSRIIKDELTHQNEEISKLAQKLDREIRRLEEEIVNSIKFYLIPMSIAGIVLYFTK